MTVSISPGQGVKGVNCMVASLEDSATAGSPDPDVGIVEAKADEDSVSLDVIDVIVCVEMVGSRWSF